MLIVCLQNDELIRVCELGEGEEDVVRVVSLLNSGADINTVGGEVCYYQCYDHVDHVDHVIQFKVSLHNQ